MEYEVIDSSGTDDDYPQLNCNRVPLGGRVTENGKLFVGSAPYQMMQIDMEFEIHNLEQIAYAAVLRAFKAQSDDGLSWEKEGLLTELRKELRMSEDEHRATLAEVNADDLIQRITVWKKSGGNCNVNHPLPSPTVSASRKKQKTGNPFGTQSLHPLSSSVKRGPNIGIRGRRPNAVQVHQAKPLQLQVTDHGSSGVPMDDGIRDPLIGRRVMIRWPADNNFYEAVITEYNAADGRHSLVYDSNTPNATLEWVDIKEVPSEDIQWVDDVPVISRPVVHDVIRVLSTNQFANEIRPSRNGVVTKEDLGEIEILHTDTLLKKVENVLNSSHPDELEMEKAKKMLKEHEHTLINVIAKLADACDSSFPSGGVGEHPLLNGRFDGEAAQC